MGEIDKADFIIGDEFTQENKDERNRSTKWVTACIINRILC